MYVKGLCHSKHLRHSMRLVYRWFNQKSGQDVTLQEKYLQQNSKSNEKSKEPTAIWTEPQGHTTGVSVYNSLTKSKCPLILPKGQILTWYICGPTVYDSAHIGHACSYIRFDIIRRILCNVFNIDIVLTMGITDIDDKIINKARELNMEYLRVARQYEMEFVRDMAAVNVQPPLATLRVTDFVYDIVLYIQKIINNGLAYATESGNVFFDVNKYGKYGKLWTHSMTTEIREAASPEKKSARDFALWKAAKPGEPWWQAPWGKGRPGWHIECSTIASSMFGSNIDVHSGGDDLRFPHHENEVAQSEAHFCCNQWVNYWIHCGHLHLKNDTEKMSKSLKNYITVPDLLSKYTANQFRVFCLLSHYRKAIEYSDESMQKAVVILRQLDAFLECADAYVRGQSNIEQINEPFLWQSLSETQKSVKAALEDDFDTPKAMDAIKSLLRAGNIELGRNTMKKVDVRSPTVIAAIIAYLHRIMNCFGIQLSTRMLMSSDQKDQQLTHILDNVVQFRSSVRLHALNNGPQAQSQRVQQALTVPAENSTEKVTSDDLQRIQRHELLQYCDKFRDDMVICGIQIKDRGKDSSWQILEDQSLKGKSNSYGSTVS